MLVEYCPNCKENIKYFVECCPLCKKEIIWILNFDKDGQPYPKLKEDVIL